MDRCLLDLGRWRGRVASAVRGRRGQQFLRDTLAALDAMPEKRLIAHEIEQGGECCTLGALIVAKGLDGEAISWPDNDCCPIWAMYWRRGCQEEDDEYPEDVYEAGRRLGLTTSQVTRFIDAADHENTAYKGLRERLLGATVNKQCAGRNDR